MKTVFSRISVLLPVHNGMPYLPATIESLRAQTLRDFEAIVIDDGSTDDTPQYLQSLDDQRFRYFRTDRVGLVSALNFGLRLVNHELVARIDADDIAYPQRLAAQRQCFTEEDRLVLLGSQYDRIDEAGSFLGRGRCLTSDLANRWLLLFTSCFPHPGVMFRRSAVMRAGCYDPKWPVAQDYHLFVELAKHGTVSNCKDALIQKREHAATVGAQNSERQRRSASFAAGKHAMHLGLTDRSDEFSELYRFLWWGELPSSSSFGRLVSIFRLAAELFRAKEGFQRDRELQHSILDIEQRLRWRCHSFAFAAWSNPIEMTKWLRIAKEFDPVEGSLRSCITRAARRALGRMRRRGEPQELLSVFS